MYVKVWYLIIPSSSDCAEGDAWLC
jgi:hypothetical protein